MKKWIVSAVFYLIVIISGYIVYDEFFKENISRTTQGEEQHNSNHSESQEGHSHETEASEKDSHEQHEGEVSEVNIDLGFKEDLLTIKLTELDGDPVSELEINHEKYMHLIIVDEHLDVYNHLHPIDLGDGEFEIKTNLKNGTYKAFIDIKPNGLSYKVNPVSFVVGESDGHRHTQDLKPDDKLIKNVDGETVKLNMSSQKVGEPVTLDFELDTSNLEPYLGALGHVVILDENAENYLHVHPKESVSPVFVTQFDKSGVYKIWAEFKQDGKVRVFPFVVEVK